MKLFFVTPEEPFHLPAFFQTVASRLTDSVIGIAIVSPIYKRHTWFTQAWQFINAFGVKDFAVEAAYFGVYKMLDFVSQIWQLGQPYSVRQVARAHHWPVYHPHDVNDPKFLERLRSLEPDVVVSVSSPQIFKEELIAIPRLGCINVHGALLPHYRGVLPSFWMLAKGENRAGVTVHCISAGIDTGAIIAQRSFRIKQEDTLHSLISRSKQIGAQLLLEVIAHIRDGHIQPKPNLEEEGSYFSFPTSADVAEFRSRGRRLR